MLPRSPWRIQALFNHAPEDSHDEMRAAYPGLPISRAAADFGGDYAFWYPSIVVAGLHSRFAPVHFYRFDIAPRLMHLLGLGLDATHGIEMYALFDQVDSPFARTMTALGGREPFSRAGAGPGCTSPAPASSRATRRGIPNQTA
ncbi:para-nitrobenzyl esterase [Cryobacterium flavum]|uniref:Para-nitrobenzyl esterase n=1 Tax=Cryobacterium flavum TaxID=1424659 RepID=A0A5E9FU40_9MICO|nr:para-nitrobenzyl esterase [Cryobacterium flavum]